MGLVGVGRTGFVEPAAVVGIEDAECVDQAHAVAVKHLARLRRHPDPAHMRQRLRQQSPHDAKAQG